MKALLKREMPDYDLYVTGRTPRKKDKRKKSKNKETRKLKSDFRKSNDDRSLKQFAKDHKFGPNWFDRKKNG